MAYEQCNTHIVAILRLLGCRPTEREICDNNLAVQSDRRPVGYSATLVTVTDSTGREITTFRSPRKLGKALVSSAARRPQRRRVLCRQTCGDLMTADLNEALSLVVAIAVTTLRPGDDKASPCAGSHRRPSGGPSHRPSAAGSTRKLDEEGAMTIVDPEFVAMSSSGSWARLGAREELQDPDGDPRPSVRRIWGRLGILAVLVMSVVQAPMR